MRLNGVHEYEWRGNHLYLCTAIYIFTSIVKFLTLAIVNVMDILDKALALGSNNNIEAYFTIWSFSLAFPMIILMVIFNKLWMVDACVDCGRCQHGHICCAEHLS